MARLIDGDALIEKFNEKVDMAECLIDARMAERFATFCALADAVEEMPTVDAVEVVRCKDCKYQRKVWIEDKRYKFGGFLCVSCDRNDDIFVSHTVNGDDNDFCSYGERKNEVIE